MSTWIAFWNILKKDVSTYYLKPPNISWGIIFPLAWTLMFYLRSQGAVDVRGLLLAPIDYRLLVLAKTTGAILFGVASAVVPLVLGSLVSDVSSIVWIPLLGSILLISITSALLGLFIAVSVQEVFEAMTFSNFIRFPMLFLCGLFIPVTSLPLILRPLSFCLPLTYGVDVLKTAVNGNGSFSLLLNFGILFAFSIVLFSLSLRNVRRTLKAAPLKGGSSETEIADTSTQLSVY